MKMLRLRPGLCADDSRCAPFRAELLALGDPLWCSRLCPERGISGGLMAAVGLGVAAAEAALARAGKCAARCVIACDNSPASVTLAGEPTR